MKELRIVIPTKNEEKYLPLLLDSIKMQTYKNYEIVVADANSTDKTKEIAKKYKCKIVKGGYPDVGRNNGSKNCKTLYILFIDSDCLLPNEFFLEKTINEFKKRNLDLATILQKPILFFNIKKIKKFFYILIHNFVNLSFKISEKTKFPLMQSYLLFKTRTFKKLGGFPPYEFGEDSAIAKKAVKQGYKFGILYEPGKILISVRRYESKGLFKMLLKYSYFNILRMFGKEHLRKKEGIKYWD